MNRKQLTIEAELTLEELRFAEDLRGIVRSNLQKVYSAINFGQVNTNWNIGRRIVEEEQHGQTRAEYGKRVIAIASQALTEEFGKGYSQTNCKSYRKFYIEFQKFAIGQTLSAQSPKQIQQTVSAQFENELELLPWSHYERLMRVTDKAARIWYMHEAAKEMWSFRTLNRNINTQYYERMLLSQMSNEVKNEMIQNTVPYQRDKFEFIKNPTVLEFLGLPGNKGYTEQKIEQAIIDNMEHFLLEMGKGFALVARQQLIRTPLEDYYVDLVFYNYLLKCFVLIDLKLNKVTYQDVGQMDMYVKMYDELRRGSDDNPTIGIVLCSETDENIARYSVLKGNEQLFATKYKLILPSAQELQDEISRQTALLRLQLGEDELKMEE
ncbi:PDDEXK nuclease domain-containing protein [Bacteroides cellulosilyticus]|jgi:predicted nuclease of restriction endonuclease-like (RecB) superfamily|uniref:PDDEXK nuclease domain-containing protein n=1 Tax=Bacteroides cellulosilyticus TaxID=246787 RepID=UPI00189D5773|nr:PDDEXK nuclease domain-containing protein [Bacteroides cellulosilyticus]